LLGLVSGDADLATKYASADKFIQHDPSLADGAAGLREQIGRHSGARLDVVRVMEDGDLVMVHGEEHAHGCTVFFAVFRFETT
jgi:predicted SnoaL-like aldol condensation-catalyzing enzyme